MNRFARFGLLAVCAAGFVVSTVPAQAAPVDKATFEQQLSAAVLKANPVGKAERVTQKMTINTGGPKPLVFTASRVVNPNGSSVAKSTFLGASETRCVSKFVCYSKAGKSQGWFLVKDGKGATQVDDTLKYWSYGVPSESATFDVSGSTFSMKDSNKVWKTVVSGSSVLTTVELSDPASPQTGLMVISEGPAKSVKVVKPSPVKG